MKKWLFIGLGIIWGLSLMAQNLPDSLVAARGDWEKFYEQQFNLTVSFKEVKIPTASLGKMRLLFVPANLSLEQVLTVVQKHFKTTPIKTTDLIDERLGAGNYCLAIRDRLEADEELSGASVKSLRERGILGMTLKERLLLELKFFLETGGHLDKANLTLCPGTANEMNKFPAVGWDSDNYLMIAWFGERYSGSEIRARQVIP